MTAGVSSLQQMQKSPPKRGGINRNLKRKLNRAQEEMQRYATMHFLGGKEVVCIPIHPFSSSYQGHVADPIILKRFVVYFLSKCFGSDIMPGKPTPRKEIKLILCFFD